MYICWRGLIPNSSCLREATASKARREKASVWERKGKSSTGSEISELQNLNVLETRSSVAFTDEHANLLKFCDLKVKSAESTPHKFRVCCFYRCYFSIFFYV